MVATVAADKSYTEGPITKENLLSGKKAKMMHARQYSMTDEKEKSGGVVMPPIKSAQANPNSQVPPISQT